MKQSVHRSLLPASADGSWLSRGCAAGLCASPAATLAASALILAYAAHAAAPWPVRPIRIAVTFPPDGASDIVARLLSSQMAERVGQTVVVENRQGAGSTLGTTITAQAQSDGHTLVLSNTAPDIP